MSPIARSILVCVSAVLLPAIAPALTARAADSVQLKPTLAQPYEEYVEHEVNIEQRMAGPDGKPMNVKAQSIYGFLQKTTPKDGGVALELAIDRLRGAMAFGEAVNSLYDTDEPDYEDASAMHKDTFAALMKAQLGVLVDAQGNATTATGGDALRAKLKAMGDANYVAKSMAEAELTDTQIMSNLGETAYVLYPFREVKVGETWKRTQKGDYPQVGRTITTYDCKLDRIEESGGRPQAVVSFTGAMIKDTDEKPAKDKRLGTIDATFSGTAHFDVKEGRFVSISRELQGKIEVPPFWTQDPAAPLMPIDTKLKADYRTASVASRTQKQTEIAGRLAAAEAARAAEEAAAMAGPVDPVTPANEPVPWLQWGGTERDFRSNATGLANRWAKDGPPKLWDRALGDSYSCILSDGSALYTTYSVRQKDDPLKGEEIIVALDANTGKTLWEFKYDAPWTKDLQMEFGPGPHSTPLIVGDRLFSIGCTAKLHCLDKKTGKSIWSKDLFTEFKADLLMRGYGSSPLAFGETIVLPVSKEKGHAVMAFKQSDGSVAAHCGDFAPGYASLLAVDAFGTQQFVAFNAKSLTGLDARTGQVLWNVDHPTEWGANICTPVWNAADNTLFISSAYGMGSRGVQLEKSGSQVTAKELWFNAKMKLQFVNAVRDGDWIYGTSGDFGPAFLACVNAKTGEFAWRQRGMAAANLVLADGKLIALDEEGTLYLVKADPTKYRLLAKAKGICTKSAWTAPTLVGRTLYVRDRAKIMALNLGDNAS